MTPIAVPSPTLAPDTIVALPGQVPAHRQHGPLRRCNPRGNPNLAPRCGAKTRTTGLACRAPAMANGRCPQVKPASRLCTKANAPGLARLGAAHTTHGDCGAAARAWRRHRRTLIVRCRVMVAAAAVQAYLPREIAARDPRGSRLGWTSWRHHCGPSRGGRRKNWPTLHVTWCRSALRGTRPDGSRRGRARRHAGAWRSVRPRERSG